MKKPAKSTATRRTSLPSPKPTGDVRTGTDRLYRRDGVRKVTLWYKYPDGRREIFATAPAGDRVEITKATVSAKRKALDVQSGQIIAGTVGELINRFKDDIDPTHYADQSKHGKGVRDCTYRNLHKIFGNMSPGSLKKIHGYQYLDYRAKAGAPILANKEMALMSTICNYAERWGVIEANPFVGMMQNKADRTVRVVERYQVVRFYLWALKQNQAYRTMGCAAMFCYLTGFRAAEIRPFHMSGLKDGGVTVISAKRKKGEDEVSKRRTWSPRLRAVVARAKQGRKTSSLFLFPNSRGQAYSKSGWASVWTDAMFSWIGLRDTAVAAQFSEKKAREALKRQGLASEESAIPSVTVHAEYFSLSDIRPTAISRKLSDNAGDAYDFAGHANPSTTHKFYDRRKEKTASATE